MEERAEGVATLPASITVELDTPKGKLFIRSRCGPDFIEGLEMEEGIGSFARYRSMVHSKEMMVRLSRIESSNVVLAYTEDGKIVGYVIFGEPSRLERWGRLGQGFLYELGSVEVSRNYRGLDIAGKMIELGMAEDWLENRVVIATGFAWHWDLQGTGLSKAEYRRRLMSLFAKFGFRHFHTNEDNIRLDSANFLMARIGSRVDGRGRDRFLDIAFGLTDTGNGW